MNNQSAPSRDEFDALLALVVELRDRTTAADGQDGGEHDGPTNDKPASVSWQRVPGERNIYHIRETYYRFRKGKNGHAVYVTFNKRNTADWEPAQRLAAAIATRDGFKFHDDPEPED